MLVVIIGLLIFYSELIFPGVQVIGINVGSMTRGEAAAVLPQEWEQQSVFLEGAEGVWPVGVTDLGFTLDAQATAQAAYEQGRSASGLRQITAKPHANPAKMVV